MYNIYSNRSLGPNFYFVCCFFFRPVGANMQEVEFITETWFMALLVSMVSVMILLFVAMLLVRRRQMLSKKTLPPSRSNGGVLTTPVGAKHDPPLWLDKETIPEFASTLPDYGKLPSQDYNRLEYNSLNCQKDYTQQNGFLKQNNINLHTNPLHQKEYTRPDRLDYNSDNKNYSVNLNGLHEYEPNGRKLKDYRNMQIQDYASPNLDSNRQSQLADYAEVDQTALIMNNGAISPAPYATTTLVTGTRRIGNSMVSF